MDVGSLKYLEQKNKLNEFFHDSCILIKLFSKTSVYIIVMHGCTFSLLTLVVYFFSLLLGIFCLFCFFISKGI